MNPQIGVYDPRNDGEGGGIGLLASLLVHAVLVTMILLNAPAPKVENEENLTYVELAESLPQSPPQGAPRVVEAPGPAIEREPSPQAPLSDADRRASIPEPSGPQRTDRPGMTDAPFIPGSPAPQPPSRPATPAAPSPSESAAEGSEQGDDGTAEDPSPDGLRFEESRRSRQETAPQVDWSSAIQEAGKIASLGPPELGTYGGDEGFAESGPISFETQWYPWGEYATSMIRKIRYHWYNNMPALVRMGVKGVVVIRFTIQRDGSITDITILQSSGHPPFDFAARKAIELSSPLKPLPADFPKPSERITAGFYYNLRPPEN